MRYELLPALLLAEIQRQEGELARQSEEIDLFRRQMADRGRVVMELARRLGDLVKRTEFH